MEQIKTAEELWRITRLHQLGQRLRLRETIIKTCVEAAKQGDTLIVWHEYIDDATIDWLKNLGYHIYKNYEFYDTIISWWSAEEDT